MSVGDASVSIHRAIIARLLAHAGVAGIVGARVYEDPPAGVAKPYITTGPMDVLTEVAEEYEGSTTTFQIDGWAEGPGGHTMRLLGREIRAALHENNLVLVEDQRLVSLTIEQTRYLREPDGITRHVAVTGTALTEPSA